MRLHVGCGSVYLREWINVDLPLPTVFLAKEKPELVERFATTEDKYYARHEDKTPETLAGGAVTKDTCCDVFGSFGFLPARAGTVAEILSRQVFEHLDRREAKDGLQECWRVLKRGGFFRVDIPDADQTLKEYRETGHPLLARHLFGPRRDVFGSHFHYSRQMLRQVVESAGFSFVEEESNIHFYPAIAMKFRRN